MAKKSPKKRRASVGKVPAAGATSAAPDNHAQNDEPDYFVFRKWDEYEKMLRENWAAPGMWSGRYDTACAVAADTLLRIMNLWGACGPDVPREAIKAGLDEIVDEMHERLLRIEHAHAKCLTASL